MPNPIEIWVGTRPPGGSPEPRVRGHRASRSGIARWSWPGRRITGGLTEAARDPRVAMGSGVCADMRIADTVQAIFDMACIVSYEARIGAGDYQIIPVEIGEDRHGELRAGLQGETLLLARVLIGDDRSRPRSPRVLYGHEEDGADARFGKNLDLEIVGRTGQPTGEAAEEPIRAVNREVIARSRSRAPMIGQLPRGRIDGVAPGTGPLPAVLG